MPACEAGTLRNVATIASDHRSGCSSRWLASNFAGAHRAFCIVPSRGGAILERVARMISEPAVQGHVQLAGLRAVTIHVVLPIITDRSPGQPAKAARTATDARARMSSG